MTTSSKWIRHSIDDEFYDLLNLKHPDVERKVIEEMENGVAVYYDRRWSLTEDFVRWLLKNRSLVNGKRILVLGAGIGWETLVLGRLAQHVHLNDFAPLSLELCEEQLRHNGIARFSLLPGDYSTMPLPEVDLAIGCFLVYNRETRTAMKALAERFPGPLLLVNENLPDFRHFLSSTERESTVLFEQEGAQGLLLHTAEFIR